MTPIVLASRSAARGKLLREAGVVFSTQSSGVDEAEAKRELLAAKVSPAGVAAVLADRKAIAVSRMSDALVIGADQTLELDGILYDKTTTLADTRTRLVKLRGRSHQLHAGLAVARDGRVIWRHLVSVTLVVRPFSDAFLEAYLTACGEAVASSVGAYHLEGLGVQLFERIDGDYFSVLGLPLLPLLAFLREQDAVIT